MVRLIAAVALALLCVAGVRAGPPERAAAQTPGQIAGALPRGGGFALVAWGSSSLTELANAASAQGCPLVSAWVTLGGALVGHVIGAPAFVNAGFAGRYPGGSIPSGAALLLVCRSSAPAPPVAQSIDAQLAAAAAAINRERAARGLAVLHGESHLTAAAEQYIGLVRDAGQLSHTLDGEPWDRARREGYPTSNVGEVLAARTYGSIDVARDGDAIVSQWLNSPAYRDIILSVPIAFTELGVGCARGVRAGTNWLYCVGVTGKP